jgi:multisubunit Na+/H+ antiporter MnhG subunit
MSVELIVVCLIVAGFIGIRFPDVFERIARM